MYYILKNRVTLIACYLKVGDKNMTDFMTALVSSQPHETQDQLVC